MSRESLLDALRRRPLVSDGAMGTQLMAAGLTPGECGELWNTSQPQLVREIHQRYRDAGCDLLTTNTFGGCPLCLAKHDATQHCDDVNRAGAALAREAAEEQAYVLGDLGPFGDFMEPLGLVSEQQVHDAFYQQAKALRDGGADGIIIETMTDVAEFAVAIRAARAVGDWPIFATAAFDHGAQPGRYFTMMGATPADVVAAAAEADANVVGANCGSGMTLDDYAMLAQQLVEEAARFKLPVMIQANAGAPSMVDGQQVYPASPEQMAQLASQLLTMGVRILGGCCGTTPEHLHAISKVVHESIT